MITNLVVFNIMKTNINNSTIFWLHTVHIGFFTFFNTTSITLLFSGYIPYTLVCLPLSMRRGSDSVSSEPSFSGLYFNYYHYSTVQHVLTWLNVFFYQNNSSDLIFMSLLTLNSIINVPWPFLVLYQSDINTKVGQTHSWMTTFYVPSN